MFTIRSRLPPPTSFTHPRMAQNGIKEYRKMTHCVAKPLDFTEFQEKFSTSFRPWQRSVQFWVRAADIYTGYKVFQVRVNFEKDVEKAEAMWERQHELAADKVYSMCSDMGGFFLKDPIGSASIAQPKKR
ncbi:hypothetical protein LXL04_025858 [Taraxacum kok-saghyz]